MIIKYWPRMLLGMSSMTILSIKRILKCRFFFAERFVFKFISSNQSSIRDTTGILVSYCEEF